MGKPRKLGKTINETEEGDSLSLTKSIEDNQFLLYLELANDVNPLYIQHDFAQKTEYQQPVIPSVILAGIAISAISKHLPGPGSHVVNFFVNFIEPISHYETLASRFEVIKVGKTRDVVAIFVETENANEDHVLDVIIMVRPPRVPKLEIVIKSEDELNK